jgi:hypothetical protein
MDGGYQQFGDCAWVSDLPQYEAPQLLLKTDQPSSAVAVWTLFIGAVDL